MEKFVTVFTKPPESTKDDDVIDRLNHRYTVMLLLVFTMSIGAQLYMVGKPITCWADKHFTGNHIKYTNAYCWVRNTYYLPFDEEIPHEHEEEKRNHILYYQWLPFILLAQALFFWLPSGVWHGLNQKGGIDCDNILSNAGKVMKAQEEKKRTQQTRIIVNQMDRFLGTEKEAKGSRTFSAACIRSALVCCGTAMGNYLCVLYIFAKCLHLLNVVVQLFFLNAILKTNYSLYGYEFMTNVLQGDHWMNSPSFPRVTMCDFKVRRLGNIHRYTVQCVLPINMYTEKIYAFLWFWMVMVAVVTGLNLATWIARCMLSSDRLSYIMKHLRKDNEGKKIQKKEAKRFMDEYLKQDGVFILRLIGHNTNNMICTEVAEAVFNNWKTMDQEARKMADNPESDYNDDERMPINPSAPEEAEALPPKQPLPQDGGLYPPVPAYNK